MTAQGIMNGAGSAMNAVFSGFPAVGGSVKGTQDASFEQFMETSKSGNEGVSKTPTYEKGVKENSVEPKDVKEQAKEFFTGDSKVKEAPKAQPEESTEVSAEVAEAVSALLVQVRQVICETLGITEEQLNASMEELGLQDADLFDRGSLQQLFLQVNQAEPTEFLTNETLFGEFTELLQTVEQAVEEFGVEVENVQEILKTAEATPELVAETEQPEVVTKQETDGKEPTAEADEPEGIQSAGTQTEVSGASSEAKTETGNDEIGRAHV